MTDERDETVLRAFQAWRDAENDYNHESAQYASQLAPGGPSASQPQPLDNQGYLRLCALHDEVRRTLNAYYAAVGNPAP